MNPLSVMVQSEIANITKSTTNSISSRFECIVHTASGDFKPFTITELILKRDYLKKFSDVLSVEANFIVSDAVFGILPNKDSLTVTINKIPTLPTEVVKDDVDATIYGFTYNALLWDSSSAILEQKSLAVQDPIVAARVQDLVILKFQLTAPGIERVRAKSVGGIFRELVPTDLIRYLLGKHSKSDEADTTVLGVDVASGHTTRKFEHIPIPHDTRVVDAPKIIERAVGGIYPTGMNYYLQDRMWYVFPPYDIQRFTKASKTLTIINVTKDRLPSIERTYRLTDSQVVILSTSDVVHSDTSDAKQVNLGNAVRFIDSEKIVDGFVKTGENKAVISRSNTTKQYMAESRVQGDNYVGTVETKLTSNYLLELSALAERSGGYAQISWENGNPNFLYPGMPCRVIYATSDVPTEVYGIVIGTQTLCANISNNPVDRHMRQDVAIDVFINRHIKPSKEDDDEQT